MDSQNTLDFVSNVYVIHWYVSDNWKRNDIQLITKDFKNYITVRESINDYDLDEIRNSSKRIELIPYNYKGEQIQLIYSKFEKGSLLEESNDAFLGFIRKINNKSYTFLYDLEVDKSKIIYKGKDPKEKIDYIYDMIFKSN